MDVIDRINAILKKRGMNGAELSRLIGVSTAVYSQWNTRKTKPSNKNIVKVANALNVPVSELTGEGEKEKPAPEGELTVNEIIEHLDGLTDDQLLQVLAKATEALQNKNRPEKGGK